MDFLPTRGRRRRRIRSLALAETSVRVVLPFPPKVIPLPSPRVLCNPLGFTCAPNAATPDYVIYRRGDFRHWLAYGLMRCWLSTDANDPNADCHFSRPIDTDDVQELRGHFLDLVETVVKCLWVGDFEPGHGEIDGNYCSLTVHNGEDSDPDETIIAWYARLDEDAIRFDMVIHSSRDDPLIVWLGYDAIEETEEVMQAIRDARNTLPPYARNVWDQLDKAAACRLAEALLQETT